jgi:hypothetical protein
LSILRRKLRYNIAAALQLTQVTTIQYGQSNISNEYFKRRTEIQYCSSITTLQLTQVTNNTIWTVYISIEYFKGKTEIQYEKVEYYNISTEYFKRQIE